MRPPSRSAPEGGRAHPRREPARAPGRIAARVLREGNGGHAPRDLGHAGRPHDRHLQRDGAALRARTGGVALAVALLGAAGPAATRGNTEAAAAPLSWASKSRYRLLLDVDPRGVRRSHSVAAVDVDFAAELAARGASGEMDESTIDVVAYDAAGRPRPYDPSRAPDERVLIPWRLDRTYPGERVTLRFVVPDERATRFAVYFDTAERARPPRYPGLVGDGDLFTVGWGRREIAANASDTFVDLDRDGDLDLVKGGTEPFLYVYENRGQGRFVDRGRLTSAGEVLTFPRDDANRSWVSVEFADWDGDGDPDLFASFRAGPYENRVVRYENVTAKDGPLDVRGPRTGRHRLRGAPHRTRQLRGLGRRRTSRRPHRHRRHGDAAPAPGHERRRRGHGSRRRRVVGGERDADPSRQPAPRRRGHRRGRRPRPLRGHGGRPFVSLPERGHAHARPCWRADACSPSTTTWTPRPG